jgi:hypothetical protein
MNSITQVGLQDGCRNICKELFVKLTSMESFQNHAPALIILITKVALLELIWGEGLPSLLI